MVLRSDNGPVFKSSVVSPVNVANRTAFSPSPLTHLAQVYATAWRRCGFDSMILPTTQKFMINHLGFFYVLKYPHNVRGGGVLWEVVGSWFRV